MQRRCPPRVSGAVVIVPCPSPDTVATMQNTRRDSMMFLQAAGIKKNSKEHRELKKTIQTLHPQYLHRFKYIEEQSESKVNQLIAKAHTRLPWLGKYEDGWPARIYLKRYVDTRRPHLGRSRHEHGMQPRTRKSEAFHKEPTRDLSEVPDAPLMDHDFTVREFLGSLAPSLEHHLNAFVGLGVKDQETLQAFLSWPQVAQAQFLDEAHGVLQLTNLEKKGLLIASGQLAQKALERSFGRIVDHK